MDSVYDIEKNEFSKFHRRRRKMAGYALLNG
jgi:hypothetical protein